MFAFNTADPADFAAAAKAIGQNFKVMENGEGIVIRRGEK
jgi:hypothetical protein